MSIVTITIRFNNVQIECDFAYRITNINAKWPGSRHDSTIYQETQLYQDFKRHPTGNSGILLGDSGYACSNTPLDTSQKRQDTERTNF